MIEKYPSVKMRLKNDVLSLETSISNPQLLNCRKSSLHLLHRKSWRQWKKYQSVSAASSNMNDRDDSKSLSISEQALKKRKVSASRTLFLDSRFIVPTTNIVDQFFWSHFESTSEVVISEQPRDLTFLVSYFGIAEH